MKVKNKQTKFNAFELPTSRIRLEIVHWKCILAQKATLKSIFRTWNLATTADIYPITIYYIAHMRRLWHCLHLMKKVFSCRFQ